MRYEKPELDIEKFDIVEEITGEGVSAKDIIIDEGGNTPGFEEGLADAFSNILGIK